MNNKIGNIFKNPSFLALGLSTMIGLMTIAYAYLNTTNSNTTDIITLFVGIGIVYFSLTTINKILDRN